MFGGWNELLANQLQPKKQNKKWPNRKKSRHSSPMKTFSLRDKVVLKGGQLLKYFQIKCNSRVRKKKKATKKITGFWIETSNCSSPLMKEFPRLFDIHMRRRKKKTLAFSLPILSYTHIWIFSVVFFCKRQTQKFTWLISREKIKPWEKKVFKKSQRPLFRKKKKQTKKKLSIYTPPNLFFFCHL